jgi:hypothetical protein
LRCGLKKENGHLQTLSSPDSPKLLRMGDISTSASERQITVLAGYFDLDFWNRFLLQFCHTNRHAVLALSILHEQFMDEDDKELEIILGRSRALPRQI